MKSCYLIKLGTYQCAIADLCDYYAQGKIITRINVPTEFRKQGKGAELLKMILADADREQVRLFLEVSASGEMDNWALEQWYMKHGFKHWRGIMMRKPKFANS